MNFSDDSLELHQTFIAGMSGSGKTTFALRYLKNCPCACRFIFDDMGTASRKLNIPALYTAQQLEAALPSRWVVFNPARMFPGDTKGDGFNFFCQFVMAASRRGPGKKLFLADEIWRWCTPSSIPSALATISQMGRMENIELVTASHRPNRVNESITGQTTEIVCFRLDSPNALAKIAELTEGKLSEDKIRNLPLGKYISLNRLSGGVLAGSVF